MEFVPHFAEAGWYLADDSAALPSSEQLDSLSTYLPVTSSSFLLLPLSPPLSPSYSCFFVLRQFDRSLSLPLSLYLSLSTPLSLYLSLSPRVALCLRVYTEWPECAGREKSRFRRKRLRDWVYDQ